MSTITIPPFLDHQYFKTALENGLKIKDVKIANLQFSMGSGPGENFLSSVYRVLVTYVVDSTPSKSISLIVKVVPDIPLYAGGGSEMHKKEAIMYFEILPAIEKGLREGRMSPRGFFAALEEPKTIVLEDLKDLGYRLSDRQKGLDEDHCKLVLEKLAQFHALSILYAEKNPKQMEHFKEGVITPYSVKTPAFEMTHWMNFKSTISLAESWPGYEAVAQKMKAIQTPDELAERLLAVAVCSNDSFKILNHGDMWINNFLFKYGSNGKPEDLIFVDYQCSVYGSPGNDVNHFLGLSPAADVLKNRHEHMIREYYYQSFKRTLENVGYGRIPNEEAIIAEIRRKESYGILLAIGVLPILSMDTSVSKDNTLENMSSGKVGSNMQNSMLSSRFQDAMKYWLKRASENNIFG